MTFLRSHAILFIAALFIIIFASREAQSGVILKITAENPSQFEERLIPVKLYLPAGIKPQNIIDKGELEIAYDVKQGQYYVYKETALKPQESVTYQVEIEDIWLIDEAKLYVFKSHTEEIADKLKKTEYREVAEKLKEAIDKNIHTILTEQAKADLGKVGAAEHINAYESNQKLFGDIQKDVGTLENLVIGIGKDAGKIMGESSVATKALDEVVQEAKRSAKLFENFAPGKDSAIVSERQPPKAKTIVIKIEVSNPSKEETRSIAVTYFLPKEVGADDVIDSKELEVRYDFEKSLYYLFNKGVELGPQESKIFDVVIRDKWAVSETKLLSLKTHAQSMVEAVAGIKEFSSVEQLGKEAIGKIDEILNRENISGLDEQYIAQSRQRQAELDSIERIVARMEDALRQAGVSPGLINEERMRQIKKMLQTKKPYLGTGPDPKGVKLLAGTIFKGKAPSIATTWKIIYIIIFFLMITSSIFFFVQIKQRRGEMFDSLTGAFSRRYILDRFKEELKIAKIKKSKCSLLVLDVDKFKKINDTYGHSAGDAILKEFVIIIRKMVRATDMVGRFGGDEFTVVLPTADKDKALMIAERIRKATEENGIVIDEKNRTVVNISTSIGIAVYPDNSMTAEDLFDKADKALHSVKLKGGSGVSVYV